MLRIRLEGLVATVIALALFIIATPAQAAVTRGWAQTGSMSIGRTSASAVLLANGTVMVAGGDTTGGPTARVEIYHPDTGAWSPAASMLTARWGFVLVQLPNGKVLAAGGRGPTGLLSTAEVYDPSSNVWTAVDRMSVPRGQAAAVLLPNGKVLVAGGTDGTTAQATADIYDPVTQAWSFGGTFVGGRYQAAAALLNNGAVLLTGGTASNGAQAISSLFTSDPNVWRPVGSMPTPRTNLNLTALRTGQALASGGENAAGPQTTTAIYDAASGTWLNGTPMNFAHDGGTATLMTDGDVLEAGGKDVTGANSAFTELYDPLTRQWTLAGTLFQPRSGQTSTLLDTGQVLIAGGTSSSPLPSAEIYTPTTDANVDPGIAFNDTNVGNATTGVVGITNTGNQILLLSDLAIGGQNGSDFSIIDNGCSMISPGASCQIHVRFAPGGDGSRNGALRFSANTTSGGYAVSLSGRGTTSGPPLVLRPTPKIDVKVVYLFKHTKKTMWFQKLEVTGAPKGSTITVTCAKGCAKKKYVKRNSKGAVSIKTIVGKRHIKVGRTITVVVGHTGYVAAVKKITIGKHSPSVTTRCLPAGAKKSVSCSSL